jgi:hypothetical protein
METLSDVKTRSPGFKALRKRVLKAGTDSLAHFRNGYTREGGLSLQQNPDEFAALCLYLKERGPFAWYLEIGAGSGGACRFIHETVGLGNVISIDDGRHPRAGEQAKNFEALTKPLMLRKIALTLGVCKSHFARAPIFHRHVGDSHDPAAAEFLQGALGGNKLDLAFIDGDHSYEGVRQDVDLALPFCRPKALVLFHDTVACPPVRAAWLQAVDEQRLLPLAEFVGQEVPLGIAVNMVQ